MLRSRIVRPSICTNEVLASLDPYAEILFIRLWMLADREGRLEDRPARIKALLMPFYTGDVENLLKTLADADLIRRYKVAHLSLIEVKTFRKHQVPNAHETKSTLPPPPGSRRNGNSSNKDKPVRNAYARTDHAHARTDHACAKSPCVCVCSSREVVSNIGGVFKKGDTGENTPPNETRTQPPAAANTNTSGKPARACPLPPGKPCQRSREPAPAARAPVDFWPHRAEDVEYMRTSLVELARVLHMPVADDQILRQILDSARGARSEDIHRLLAALWRKRKFESMYSWGLLPLVVGQHFRNTA